MTSRHGAPLIAVIPILLLSLCFAVSEDTPAPQPMVFEQALAGANTCGPCSLLVALSNGGSAFRAVAAAIPGESPQEKAAEIIERFGGQPSMPYEGKKPRFSYDHGTAAEDLVAMANDLLAGKAAGSVRGEYLDRKTEEPQTGHLLRVMGALRKSLESGFPPILDIRSYAARETNDGSKWFGIGGHLVTVLEIQEHPATGERGFRLRYADTDTGHIETGYVHLELTRDFAATRTFSVNEEGTELWNWVTDYPYLLITSPSLQLNTQRELWQVRTTIALRFAVIAE